MLRTKIICFAWAFVNKMHHQTLSQIYWARNSGGVVSNLCYDSPSRWFWYLLPRENCWSKLASDFKALDLVGPFAASMSLGSVSAAVLLECEDENISFLGNCSSLPQDSDFGMNYENSCSPGGTFMALVFLTSRMTGLPASFIWRTTLASWHFPLCYFSFLQVSHHLTTKVLCFLLKMI